MDERLKKQMDFILEVDKVKNIMRQTYLADGNRKENDAEHSWHLALMAVLLKEYAPEEVDLSKVIPMVLIHDLVEIDAGDTYAYDDDGAKTKRAREKKGADRIFGLLPEDQGKWLYDLWRNSRPTRHRRLSMLICWTTASRFSSMMPQTESAG